MSGETLINVSQLENIGNKNIRSVTFNVDKVKPSNRNLPTTDGKQQFAKTIERNIKCFFSEKQLQYLNCTDSHPLINAVHTAFSQHFPLTLTPDVIWLTIIQGFSHHINLHSEKFRDKFVDFDGKKTLEIPVYSISYERGWWIDKFSTFNSLMGDHLKTDLRESIECSFSTTTLSSKIASQIVLMEIHKKYFDYVITCICGIPKITLKGEISDWQNIKDRLNSFKGFELDWWLDRLHPIIDEFILASDNKANHKFWQKIYKPKEAYGTENFIGWIADLFPYLIDENNVPNNINPLLQEPRKDLYVADGISQDALPKGLSCVNIRIADLNGSHLDSVDCFAGFFGVQQNTKTHELNIDIGWAVTEENQYTKLLHELRNKNISKTKNHSFTFLSDLLNLKEEENTWSPEASGNINEFVEMFSLNCIQATDNENAQFLVKSQLENIVFDNSGQFRGAIFAELPNNQLLAEVQANYQPVWYICLLLDVTFDQESQNLKANKFKIIAKGTNEFINLVKTSKDQFFFESKDFPSIQMEESPQMYDDQNDFEFKDNCYQREN